MDTAAGSVRLKDVNKVFARDLRDPEFIEGYLSDALEDDDASLFLLAVHHVVQANEGMSPVNIGSVILPKQD